MGFFDALFLQASTPAPDADFWYHPMGQVTAAGVRLTEDGAKKVSAWFRGREILATTLAMLPLQVFERLPNDQGSEVADRHPLYDLLHRKPNDWQDSFGWRRQAMYHLIDHGNAYAWIRAGSRGFVDSLSPIHPRLVTPKLRTTGQKVFEVRDPTTGVTRVHTSDEVFHLCGMSDDGVCGVGILEYAREALGLNVVLREFASRVFSRGTLSSGAIEVPGKLDTEASKRMAESFITASGNWHLPKVLEQGAKWVQSKGMTPEDAQMLNSQKFGINEMARFLGVPPHMLADLDRSTNNNIEHQGQEFIDYTEGPWLSLWEFAINDQLIARPERFYAEFKRDALVRGDIATRWQAYVHAITTGTFTRNEVRRMENRKKLPGLDTPLDPAFLTGRRPDRKAVEAEPERKKASPSEREEDRRASALAQASAARLLRKEIAAMQKYAVKHAADGDAFVSAVHEFYLKHVALVVETLQVSTATAERYCLEQARQIVTGAGLAVLETWATDVYAAGLGALALDQEAA